jgi:N,N-dimethylformamidase
MFEFDKSRAELAREFKANPYGRHSPDLQYLLNFMRRPTDDPFHVLMVVAPGQRWRLATLAPGAIAPPRLTELEFTSLEDAEWHVFRERWTRLAGEECPIT